MKDAVPRFQADQYSSDGKLSNSGKIAAIWTGVYNLHFDNRCKCGAFHFYNGRGHFYGNKVFVWLIFRVHRTQ